MPFRISLAVAATCAALPAAAWEAGVDGALCTLSHTEADITVRLTYDPGVPLYTISLTAPEPWPLAPSFAMRFEGEQPNVITTDRHVLSPDRRTLSVSDRGFGNVLDGLAGNETATGISGLGAISVGLEGAAPEVAAFRACWQTPSV